MNKGSWSEFFNLSRSVKQGCPLSGSLFVLIIEILALKIRQNPSIKGISMGEYVQTLAQYTDDLWTDRI